MTDLRALEQTGPDRLQPDPERPTRTKYRYGVDLYNRADLQAPLHGKLTTKLEYLTDQEGRQPLFVGRYIKNPNPKAEVSKEEIAALRKQGISLLPIYCPTQAHVETKGDQGRKWGEEAAKNAVGLAGTLHIPNDVFVYANIEPHWALTSDWVIGWCEGYGASAREGYGGLYCGLRHVGSKGSIVKALDELDTRSPRMFMAHHVLRPAVWLTLPDANGRRSPDWLPTVSPEIGDVDIWQYGIGVVGPKLDATAWGYDRDIASLYAYNHMWGSD
jgi:hypothetical protein